MISTIAEPHQRTLPKPQFIERSISVEHASVLESCLSALVDAQESRPESLGLRGCDYYVDNTDDHSKLEAGV